MIAAALGGLWSLDGLTGLLATAWLASLLAVLIATRVELDQARPRQDQDPEHDDTTEETP